MAQTHEGQRMDILKSVNVALAKRGMKKAELAAVLGRTPASLSRMINSGACSGKVLAEMAAAVGMQVSEFIALGED
jgi:DNA-binding Xre family transcriptional regulator